MGENKFNINDLIDKGLNAYQSGEYKEALEYYNKALEIDLNSGEAWFRKGMTVGVLGNLEEAIRCHEEALKIAPDFIDALFAKGMALGNLGKFEESIECYDKLLELDPEDIRTWEKKAFALGILRRHEEAIECYEKLIEFNSEDKRAWFGKGRALEQLGCYEEAIACFNKTLAIDPDDDDAIFHKELAISNLMTVDKLPLYNTLKFTDSNICTQCNKEILDGDKVFVDGVGIYLKDIETIEFPNNDISMYHFDCIVVDPVDIKKENGIYFEVKCSKCVHKDVTYDGKPCNLCKFNEYTTDRIRAKSFYEEFKPQ